MKYIVNVFLLIVLFLTTSCDNGSSAQTKDSLDRSSNELKVNNYLLVVTGQTLVYDNDGNIISNIEEGDPFYGQDGNYQKGKKMSFEKSDEGTIIDANTGLMWQEIPTSEGFDWQGAKDYCENLSLSGYDDWRMPTLKELFSISDFSAGWPYLDTTYFSLVNNSSVDKSEQYWSSNNYVGHTEEGGYNAVFGVNHATGHIKAYPGKAPDDRDERKGPPQGQRQPPPGSEDASSDGNRPTGNPMLKHVRAVRGSIYGVNDFQNNNNGTITDNATGLMWATKDSEKGLDWQRALTYAENSELAGHSDWRLPNVKELQSIVDYSFSPSAKVVSQIGPSIDPMFYCSEISNEKGDKDYPYYWTSTSARFQKGKPYYFAWYVAFGRAVNNQGLDFHGAGAVRFDNKVKGGPSGEDDERVYNYVRLVRNVSQ